MKNQIRKFMVLHGLRKSRRTKFESNGFFYYNDLRLTFTRTLPLLQGGRALDIGAGFGNEVKVLLKKGFEVVATDSNPEAVRHLQKLAKRTKKLFTTEQSLPRLKVNGVFDLVVCEMVLHFLNRKNLNTSIRRMQALTSSGGLNVVSTYIEDPRFHSDPRITPGYFTTLLEPNELRNFYKGWEVLYYEEKSNTMSFPSARIIARKK